MLIKYSEKSSKKKFIGTFKWRDSDKNPDTVMFHGVISNDKLLRFEIVRGSDL